MRYGIKTMDELPLHQKTVLLRVDINEPIHLASGKIEDTTRIEASVKTIRELSESGCKLVVLAHQGSDIEYSNFYSTKPHASVLSELLGKQVHFIDDVCGPAARERIASLQSKEILLLDNVRFMSEEQTLFELQLKLTRAQQANTQVVSKLAPLADYFICDAFAAAHRDQPSICGFCEVLPSAMGRLFEQEFCTLSDLMEQAQRPVVFVVGGAKIGDAFKVMPSVLSTKIADKVLVGGVVANVMLAAQGVALGAHSLQWMEQKGYLNYLQQAKELLHQFKDNIVLPKDLAGIEGSVRQEWATDALPETGLFTDIGSKTAHLYQEFIGSAKTVFVNGPMGVFEQKETQLGTEAIWDALAHTKAYTIIGGGDSIAAANKFHCMGKIDYVCTGGGALIRFLSGEELPAVAALRYAAQKF